MKAINTLLGMGVACLLIGAITALLSPLVANIASTALWGVTLLTLLYAVLTMDRCTHKIEHYPGTVLIGVLIAILLLRLCYFAFPNFTQESTTYMIVGALGVSCIGARAFATSHSVSFLKKNLCYYYCLSGRRAKRYGAFFFCTSTAYLGIKIVALLTL